MNPVSSVLGIRGRRPNNSCGRYVPQRVESALETIAKTVASTMHAHSHDDVIMLSCRLVVVHEESSLELSPCAANAARRRRCHVAHIIPTWLVLFHTAPPTTIGVTSQHRRSLRNNTGNASLLLPDLFFLFCYIRNKHQVALSAQTLIQNGASIPGDA